MLTFMQLPRLVLLLIPIHKYLMHAIKVNTSFSGDAALKNFCTKLPSDGTSLELPLSLQKQGSY